MSSKQSFLQSAEWMEFQKSLGRSVFSAQGGSPPKDGQAASGGEFPISANIIRHDGGLGKNYLYIPHGPVIDFNAMQGGIKNPARQFVAELRELAQQENSIFIKAEPLSGAVVEILIDNGFKKSKKEIQASKTVVLGLDKSEDELLEGMHHKTRYNIKVAEKHNVSVQQSSDIDVFWKLIKRTSKRQKFSTHPKSYYKSLFEFFNKNEGELRVELFFAELEGKPVAGALILEYGDTAYYLHGGSDHDSRQVMAPYAMHWNLIKEMRKQGFKYYDFGGSESVKWPGVTRFKLQWGGQQVDYPGSFDLPTRKFWYVVYKTYRRILK